MPSALRQSKKSGQAILFLMMVLLIGTFVVLWNFDLHRAVILKMRVRDAGDAAALASARWQGTTLNTIGELNLIHAAVLTQMLEREVGFFDGIIQLTALRRLQHRVRMDGPIVAFAAAQQAAFNNGIHSYADTRFWTVGYDDVHSDFLQSVVGNGIAAELVSSRATDHPLMDPNFYDAISAAYQDQWWCLFQRYPDLLAHLQAYTTPEDYWPDMTERFPDLPDPGVLTLGTAQDNEDYLEGWEELFGTDSDLLNELQDVVNDMSDENGLDIDVNRIIGWWRPFMYDRVKWNASWQEYIDDHELPFRNGVADRYDYVWGQSIYQLHISYPMLSPGRGGDSTDWVSAAKIFGYLEGSGEEYPPHHFGLVLPAYRDARLIPVPPNVRDPRLEGHYNHHVPAYLGNGISALDDDDNGIVDYNCRYCQLLIYFDNEEFRESGLEWLDENQDKCDAAGMSPGNTSVEDFGMGPPYAH